MFYFSCIPLEGIVLSILLEDLQTFMLHKGFYILSNFMSSVMIGLLGMSVYFMRFCFKRDYGIFF